MKKLINAMTGTEMWVADNRLDEYIAAGHMPAAVPEEEPIEEMPVEETEEVAPVQPEEPEQKAEEPKKKKTATKKK